MTLYKLTFSPSHNFQWIITELKSQLRYKIKYDLYKISPKNFFKNLNVWPPLITYAVSLHNWQICYSCPVFWPPVTVHITAPLHQWHRSISQMSQLLNEQMSLEAKHSKLNNIVTSSFIIRFPKPRPQPFVPQSGHSINNIYSHGLGQRRGRANHKRKALCPWHLTTYRPVGTAEWGRAEGTGGRCPPPFLPPSLPASTAHVYS